MQPGLSKDRQKSKTLSIPGQGTLIISKMIEYECSKISSNLPSDTS